MGEFAVSIEHSEAKGVSASRGLCPPDPPTRSSAPGPRWRLRPQTPLIGHGLLGCGPPAGGKLTKWPTVSKSLDSTDIDYQYKLLNLLFSDSVPWPGRAH